MTEAPATIERIRSFKDLTIWQEAMTLTKETYALTAAFPKDETYGLSAQMRRAAVSIPSNIAERLHSMILRIAKSL